MSLILDGDGLNGYPCRDQPGTSTDEFLWEGDPDITNLSDYRKWNNLTYPAPKQEIYAACEWNNEGDNGVDLDFKVVHDIYNYGHIREHENYKNDYPKDEKDGYVSYPHPHPLVKLDE